MSQPTLGLVDDPEAAFRPIQYLGSKWRLLDAIERAIDQVAPAPGLACDLFAGTGVVAQRMASKRPVIAADIQEYSHVLSSALLEPVELGEGVRGQAIEFVRDRLAALEGGEFGELVRAEEESLADETLDGLERLAGIIDGGSLSGWSGRSSGQAAPIRPRVLAQLGDSRGTVMSRYYGGVYFSFRQAAELDALAELARLLEPRMRTVALAAVLSTASEIVSTVGNQFAQPIRPRGRDGRIKPSLLRGAARSRRRPALEAFLRWTHRYSSLRAGPFNNVAIRADFRTVLRGLPSSTSVIYADPPYTRDHYSRFYHVLETLALGDEPGATRSPSGGGLSRGVYRADRHQSPFSIKTEVGGAFRDLFRSAAESGTPVVVSYSSYDSGTTARPKPRLVTMDELRNIALTYFRAVEFVTVGPYSHSRLNRDEVSRPTDHHAETLIVATRP